ncbi:hypothetical protein DWY34_05550 [Blautia sp. AF25-12LB]|nr:hypothetical protein DWY34_05550 [Blautia sp. AF25-12LB]
MSTSTRIKRVIPVALYTVFYLLCFTYLENRHVRYHIIDSSLDDKIPSANILLFHICYGFFISL